MYVLRVEKNRSYKIKKEGKPSFLMRKNCYNNIFLLV